MTNSSNAAPVLDAIVGTLDDWGLALAAVTLVILPLELIVLRRRGRLSRQRVREMVASAIQFVPQSLSAVVIFAMQLAILATVAAVVPWGVPISWWSVPVVLLGADFLYYWEHRASHRINLLWSLFHSVHHSSPVYDQTTALRLSVFDGIQSAAFYLPLVLLGFQPELVIAAVFVVVAYQTWIHTELVGRLPAPFEWVLNTPSHHRVHHGSNREYLDKNYGGILILWDRLFGTFEPERAPVTYGLTTPIGTTNWIDVQLHDLRRMWAALRRAPSWRARWRVLAHPPTA
jgi:sterol desaturase/sphingolipid hydroxylase (fatty acid hydroxylase superfamily)